MSMPNHYASLYIKKHKNNWKYYKTHPFNWVSKNYITEKEISVIGIPKNVGQAKYIGELLFKLKNENNALNKTAVVLGDENLLIPVLNSIPKNVDALNITMGLPLRIIPLTSLFEKLFQLHKDGKTSFYYKDVISLLSHQFITPLFNSGNKNLAKKL